MAFMSPSHEYVWQTNYKNATAHDGVYLAGTGHLLIFIHWDELIASLAKKV